MCFLSVRCFRYSSSDVNNVFLVDNKTASEFLEMCGSSSCDMRSSSLSSACAQPTHASREGIRGNKIRSVSEFVKTPSPDVFGHYPPLHPEPLHTKAPGIQRSVLITFEQPATDIFLRRRNKRG